MISTVVALPLKGPGGLGERIKILKGVLPVEVIARQQDLVTVPDLARAAGQTFWGPQGHRLTVDQVQQNAQFWTVQVRLLDPPGWRQDPNQHGVELSDARGHSVDLSQQGLRRFQLREPQPEDLAWLTAAPQSASLLQVPWPALARQRPFQERTEGRGTLRGFTPIALEGKVSLRFYRFERLRTEVPFELHDVPLP